MPGIKKKIVKNLNKTLYDKINGDICVRINDWLISTRRSKRKIRKHNRSQRSTKVVGEEREYKKEKRNESKHEIKDETKYVSSPMPERAVLKEEIKPRKTTHKRKEDRKVKNSSTTTSEEHKNEGEVDVEKHKHHGDHHKHEEDVYEETISIWRSPPKQEEEVHEETRKHRKDHKPKFHVHVKHKDEELNNQRNVALREELNEERRKNMNRNQTLGGEAYVGTNQRSKSLHEQLKEERRRRKRRIKKEGKVYKELDKVTQPTEVPYTEDVVYTNVPNMSTAPQVLEPPEVPQPIQQNAPQPTNVLYPGQTSENKNEVVYTDVPYPEQIVHSEYQSHKPYDTLREEINKPKETKEEFRKNQENYKVQD